ncbi:hypothetical protein [Actinomadura alba]|uniref:SMODS-associating 2TM beta-strand rich effector domain-containing protein n=1 Tax=Actinomadura alba TaxID=406431 RepID=A0ABR7LPK7_9ACTN|nr:hypothetical protein [Actinomadura alba]MBC6466608.1 hypothetical protein [Actinomadura alba]
MRGVHTMALRFWRSPASRWTLLGLALFLFGLEIFGLRLFGKGVNAGQFGDLAAWAQSIGTVAAVTVALHQIRRERLDRLADLERAEVKERTQLYSWIGFRETEPHGWYLYFNNLTPTPVNSWVLRVWDGDADTEEEPVGTLDVSRGRPIPPGFSEYRTSFAAEALTGPHCAIDFADGNGECWRRTSSGGLRRITEVRHGEQVLARDPRTVRALGAA